jgi:hypothetical protein
MRNNGAKAMVDRKFHELTNKERLALVWYARKFDSNVREGLDRILKDDIKDLNQLKSAFQAVVEGKKQYERKSAALDNILSPEERRERRLMQRESPGPSRW